jgi:protein ImuB
VHWLACHRSAPPDTEPARVPGPLVVGRAPSMAHADEHTPAQAYAGEDGHPWAQAMGWWALQFTPRVTVLDGVVLLEVSGSERLFGGRHALIQKIVEPFCTLPLFEYAYGATSLIAFSTLLLRLRQPDRAWDVPAAEVAVPPGRLPLWALPAVRPHLATLERLGCRTWADLSALPRGGVVRRFGQAVLAQLDQALGLTPEVWPWLSVPEVFDQRHELPTLVDAAPALLWGARRVLDALAVWLRLRHHGVLALVFVWHMDPRRDGPLSGELVVRTARPTQDMAHVLRLLGEHLARTVLPSPVHTVQVRTLAVADACNLSTSLLPDEQRTGHAWHALVERLGARLGPQQVCELQLRNDHRPEHRQQWQPCAMSDSGGVVPAPGRRPGAGAVLAMGGPPVAGHANGRAMKTGVAQGLAGLSPAWLLAEPLALFGPPGQPWYQGVRLVLLAGPCRVEAGWWVASSPGGLVLRDYFVAHSPQAGWLWLFRAAQGDAAAGAAGWFLHGVFA